MELKQHSYIYWTCLVAQMVKNLPAMQETQVQSVGQEDPWRREWLPTPVFLPGESHGQRSWRATVYGVPKSQTQLKRLSMHVPMVKMTMLHI